MVSKRIIIGEELQGEGRLRRRPHQLIIQKEIHPGQIRRTAGMQGKGSLDVAIKSPITELAAEGKRQRFIPGQNTLQRENRKRKEEKKETSILH
jgi:hypothetical protein